MLIISMLCLGLAAGAQRYASFRQYVTFNAGLGINGYAYKLQEEGSKDINGGMMARLGYHYVRRDFGFWAGLMVQSYNSGTIINYLQQIPDAVDQDGDKYVHYTRYRNLEENHRQVMLSIPLELNYRLYIGDGMKLILGVGPLLQFSSKNRYSVTSGTLKTEMYYPEYDLHVDDVAPHHYLYETTGFNGKYDLKFVPGGIFDASILYPLEKNFELNIGVYGAYSFGSQIKGRNAGPYDPDCMAADAYTNAHYYGVFNSNAVSKMSPFSVGFSVGVYYYIPYEEKSQKQ